MKDPEFIIFSSDDWGWKTSKYQLSIRFAQNHKVLFVSSIGFRTPQPTKQDFTRIFVKLKKFLRGLRQINENLYVLTPIVIPFKGIKGVDLINLLIFRFQLWSAQRKLKFRKNPYLFVFSQNWLPFVKNRKFEKLIYYCVDEQAAFSGLQSKLFIDQDRDMSQLADCIFCSAKSLTKQHMVLNSATHYMPHGVNYGLFAKAIFDNSLAIPQDIKELNSPILGFWGHISYDWVDVEILKFLALKKPQWSILLIGRYSMKEEEFINCPSIHIIGEKEIEELPAYAKKIDIGLIPFVQSQLTNNCNPLKLPEYLSAGLDVVSTDIPEVHNWAEHIAIARTKEEFLTHCDALLANQSIERKVTRAKLMQQHKWERKIEQIYQIIGINRSHDNAKT